MQRKRAEPQDPQRARPVLGRAVRTAAALLYVRVHRRVVQRAARQKVGAPLAAANAPLPPPTPSRRGVTLAQRIGVLRISVRRVPAGTEGAGSDAGACSRW